MGLSVTKLEILEAAKAAGAKGLVWIPDRLAWFTKEGKRLRTTSVFSLATQGLLQIICPGGVVSESKDFSCQAFIAVLTVSAVKILSKRA
jgi:hypothetical protein